MFWLPRLYVFVVGGGVGISVSDFGVVDGASVVNVGGDVSDVVLVVVLVIGVDVLLSSSSSFVFVAAVLVFVFSRLLRVVPQQRPP